MKFSAKVEEEGAVHVKGEGAYMGESLREEEMEQLEAVKADLQRRC